MKEWVGATVFIYSKMHDEHLFEGHVANYSIKKITGVFWAIFSTCFLTGHVNSIHSINSGW